MRAYLSNPRLRFCIAVGASAGIGHALFRGLTSNLGPVLGFAVGASAIAVVVVVIFLLLGVSTKRVSRESFTRRCRGLSNPVLYGFERRRAESRLTDAGSVGYGTVCASQPMPL